MTAIVEELRPARLLLLCALMLGLAADWLLRAGPWRLGLLVWVLLAVLAAIVCRRTTVDGVDVGSPKAASSSWRNDSYLLLGATVVTVSGLIGSTAEPLYALTFLASLMFAALVAWHGRGRLVEVRISDLMITPLRAAYASAIGAPVFLMHEMGSLGIRLGRRGRQLVVGAVLAVPPFLIVGALLLNADPVFERLAGAWTSVLFEDAIEHALFIGTFAWLAGGWLRSIARPVVFPIGIPDADELRPKSDFLIVAPALGAVATLLTLYLAVQARALFGGPEYVQLMSGLSYAEYARQGFFGLAVVAAIVLSLLLIADWVIDHTDQRAVRRFRALGWVLLALVAVLVASAAYRMLLYVQFFGLSSARLYASAFMLWTALALIWCGATVMRGRRDRFGVGVLVLSAAWLLTLHLVNPDSLVARVNLQRAIDGHPLDVPYHASLSADALPAILAGAPLLNAGECTALMTQLHAVWAPRLEKRRGADWRTWSIPVARAEVLMDRSAKNVIARHCR